MTDTNDRFASSSVPMPSSHPDFTQPIEIDTIHNLNVYFDWGQNTIGFGQLSITLKDGVVTADTENMGKEWCRRALYALVDQILEKTHDENGRPK